MWSGGGASPAWSDAANWGGVAPVDGDDLVFPAGTDRPASTNDRADATYRSITVGDTRQIDGARLRLGAGGGGALHATSPILGGEVRLSGSATLGLLRSFSRRP